MISIEELAAKLIRKEAVLRRMMKSRGYLDENGEPSAWCVEGKILTQDGKVCKRGEILLVAEIGIGKIPDAELKEFLAKAEWWKCWAIPSDEGVWPGRFREGESYTAEDIIKWYHDNQNVRMELDYNCDGKLGFILGGGIFVAGDSRDFSMIYDPYICN